jgi:hypothetical protein
MTMRDEVAEEKPVIDVLPKSQVLGRRERALDQLHRRY